MATNPSTVDDLLDLLAAAEGLSARKMFGEYCLYLNGKPVGLVCDDTLFVKLTPAGRELVPDVAEGAPYPGAKLHLKFPRDQWTEAPTLCELLRITFAATPRPKPKKKKPP
jgi:DNA transformation protein and related proteins